MLRRESEYVVREDERERERERPHRAPAQVWICSGATSVVYICIYLLPSHIAHNSPDTDT